MKTILVDDELLSLANFEIECRDIEEIEVVGTFENPLKALEYASENEVDFALLDVEMPEMNGLELGSRLKEMHPKMVLIYVTGYSQYIMDALKMKADYCIMKPYDKRDVEDALERAVLLSKRKKRIQVRMFDRFDLFVDGQAVYFSNAKAKELLAICMDRCGGNVTMEEAIDKLWPDRAYDEKVKRLYRKAVMNLMAILKSRGVEDLFMTGRGVCWIMKDMVECDYFTYLENPEKHRNLFKGEYLFDYSWGEETLAKLTNEAWNI